MESTDWYLKNKGSISLEAAIVIPIFCFLVFGLVSVIQYYTLYFATANACITSAEKLGADSYIFFELGLDSLEDTVKSKILSVLPDGGIAGDLSSQLSSYAVDGLESSLFSLAMKPVIQNELDKEIKKTGIPISAKVVSLLGSNIFERGSEYRLCVRTRSDYLFPNIFTGKKGVYVDYIIKGNAWLYGGISKFKDSGINVWALSNFQRGKAIEKEFGSNLPEFFPVIDIYDRITGQCVMIASIDNSSPTNRDFGNFKKQVLSFAKKLSEFEGGETENVKISKDDIKSKKLKLIVPDNHFMELVERSIELVNRCALDYHVQLEIFQFQHSYVYEND